MIDYLGKALNVRREELAPASFLFLYLFLIIGTYIMGIAVGDGMFLAVFPNNLPHVIIGTAFFVGTFTSIYIRLSHRLKLEVMVFGSLIFFALFFAVLWWLTRAGGKWVYAVIYMLVYLVGAMGPTMGWTLGNYLLTTREARRLFGFIGAGQVLGAPVAGLATADLIAHERLRPESVLLVISVLLGACAVVVALLIRQTRGRMKGLDRGSSMPVATPKGMTEISRMIWGSRYLLLITALIAVGCATTCIVAYQFRIIASQHYTLAATHKVDKAALSAFFARFNGYMGLAAFVLQMLLTGRLLRTLGIRITLFVMPVTFLGGSAGVLLAPMLLTACILKGSHSLLRFTLDKASTELLYLPVLPPEIKSQIKSFIDGFIWRSADGLAGLTLLFFATRLKFSAGRVSLVNFFFIFGWIAIAYAVRREYLNVLRQTIERRQLDPERTAAGVLDSTTAEVLAQTLEGGGEQQVLYGLSLFEVGRAAGWHPALRKLLGHRSAAVRQRALRLLCEAGDREVVGEAEKLLGDNSLEVRTEALHYLVVQTGRDPVELLSLPAQAGEARPVCAEASAGRRVEDYTVQGAVVAYLARSGDQEYRAAAQLMLQGMVRQGGEDGVRTRAEAARVLGMIPGPTVMHGELFALLRDEAVEVVEEALVAAGKSGGREYLPVMMEKLGERPLVGAARAALVRYGGRALGTLRDYLNDDGVRMEVRKQIPEVLVRIGTGEAAGVLAGSLIQSDPGLRYEVVKGLNKLRRRDEGLVPSSEEAADIFLAELVGYYRSFQILAALGVESVPLTVTPPCSAGVPTGGLSLLQRALRERMERELERIFRLLALVYPPRDIHNAYVGTRMGRPRVQANALEVLEHLLKAEHYRLLAGALDPEVSLEERLGLASRVAPARVGTRQEAMRILLHSEDRWLRACALHAVGKGRIMELAEEVQKVSLEGDPLLEETWGWTTACLAQRATA